MCWNMRFSESWCPWIGLTTNPPPKINKVQQFNAIIQVYDLLIKLIFLPCAPWRPIMSGKAATLVWFRFVVNKDKNTTLIEVFAHAVQTIDYSTLKVTELQNYYNVICKIPKENTLCAFRWLSLDQFVSICQRSLAIPPDHIQSVFLSRLLLRWHVYWGEGVPFYMTGSSKSLMVTWLYTT